jgi:hypothetical protein
MLVFCGFSEGDGDREFWRLIDAATGWDFSDAASPTFEIGPGKLKFEAENGEGIDPGAEGCAPVQLGEFEIFGEAGNFADAGEPGFLEAKLGAAESKLVNDGGRTSEQSIIRIV